MVDTRPTSRWELKSGGGGGGIGGGAGFPVYQPPPSAAFIMPSSDAGRRTANLNAMRYPITVTENPTSAYVRCYYSEDRFQM